MVRLTGVEPARCHHRRIFLPHYVTIATFLCCSLDYTFTMHFCLGGCRLVSTPSSTEAWLGIVPEGVPPNLTPFTKEFPT